MAASRTILPPVLQNFFHQKFLAVPKESPASREERLLLELQRFGDEGRAITAIPYEYVGNDIRSLYPKALSPQLKRNYEDWHMLTPAYKLSYAGMSFSEHAASLVSGRSGNNLVQRLIRWMKEDKVVIYCDWLDKLSAFASLCVLLMTFAMSCTQMLMRAEVMYQSDGSRGNPTQMVAYTRSAEIWNFVKLLLSGIPTIVMTFNAYKRTTLPKRHVVIIGFKNGATAPKRQVAPLSPTRGDTMTSITHPVRRRTLSMPGLRTKRRFSAHQTKMYVPPP